MTGLKALAAWLDHLVNERRASPRTLEAYRTAVSAYLAFLAEHLGELVRLVDLADISAADLRAYLASRRRGERPLSARSLAQAVSAIRGFHRFCDERLGTANTAIALVRPPKVRPSAPRPVSEDQALSLIIEAAAEKGAARDWRGARDAALITLLWGCGLRISEALALTAANLPLRDWYG